MTSASKIFLSHASEDKERVLAIYALLMDERPDIASWIDRYEIVGGHSLLEKIAAGMDEADRFFIFLSPVSVTKPWVQAELRRALNQEIEGVKPGYIVPVVFGGLTQVPAFLEDKRYLALDALTKDEWLAEFDAAISGEFVNKQHEAKPNIQVIHAQSEKPHIGEVQFRTTAWAEEISFLVETTAEARALRVDHIGGGASLKGPVNFLQRMTENEVAISLPGRRLSPGQTLVMQLHFEEGTNFSRSIRGARAWDGSGASQSGTMFL